jgi:acyl-CoA synthetase (NDP forming)
MVEELRHPPAGEPAWAASVEAILEGAWGEGRGQLFEHEVYEILAALGLKTPRHVVVREEKDITRWVLSVLGGSRIVLKVICREVAHKRKAGGVRVVLKDREFIQYACRQMKSSFEGRGLAVEGILLVEYIDYDKDLGNEILLGFRESQAFGPVVSFSKGGTDAEHFAAHFSRPNLLLPPVDREWASALLASTHIQRKYLDEGKTGCLSAIVEAEVKLSDLAVRFSNFFPSPSRFAITEFEINPFAFDPEETFIALDGYATFEPKGAPVDLDVPPKETLRPLFEPRGIAVVGISATDHDKAGNIIVKNLVEMGREDLYCVNIRGGRAAVAGRPFPLYPSVRDIPADVDLAIVTVPAEATLPVVEDCAAKGVRVVLLIPGGFSETSRNRELEERISQVAAGRGIRVVGPNCLGVVYTGDGPRRGLNTFFIPEEKFRINLNKERKNVAILSQSGAMGIMEIYNLRNAISPKVIVSYGNQLDVDPSDLVQYFEEDPAVDVIGLYIEGFKRGAGRKFFNVTRRSRKPIVVYKAGRTEAGQRAALSHTASIAGEYEVAKAAMKQAGLVVADSMIDHGDLVKTFALLHEFQVSGSRVAVIANAGYEKTLAADSLGSLALAELEPQTVEDLAAVLPPFVSVDSLLDLTPMVSDEQFERCIDILLASARVDALCVSIVPQAQLLHTTDEEILHYERNIAARIVDTVHRHRKPVVVSVNVVSGADAVYNKFAQVMDLGGVPTFLTAGQAMTCLNTFIRYRLVREKNLYGEWLKEERP